MDAQNLERINRMLDEEVEIRERIKEQVTEFDKKTRNLVGILNRIHSTPSERISGLFEQARPILESCCDVTSALASIIPPDQFWKWKDMWSTSLRNAVFSATLIEYLQSRTLLSLPAVAEILGFRLEWKDKITLSVEDYLHGVITLVNELSRLAVNSVTLGDFDQPIKISVFVKDIFAGFSMLNLKNDTLRRRYDSLKYDIKKIEEVVYDVSLRKLVPSSQNNEEQPPMV